MANMQKTRMILIYYLNIKLKFKTLKILLDYFILIKVFN